MKIVLRWRQRTLDKCGGTCFPSHQKRDRRNSQITDKNRRMTFNSALSVAGILLLYITGSFCQIDVCGQTSLRDRIVGGEDAMLGKWPWQVSIHDRYGYHCGGTLITKDWVLSAAHCLQGIILPDIVMYFGRLKQSGSIPYETSRSVRRIHIHPNYSSSTFDNDIALIELNVSVTFLYNIKPVCLAAANSTFAAGTESWVTGWGFLQNKDTRHTSDILHRTYFPDTLQEVMIPVVSNSDCNNAYKRIISITSNMICAGLLNQGGKDACLKDSGGPMVNRKGFLWIQSGIVSFGEGCADPKYPGVYTRVSQYKEWIQNKTGNYTPGFVEFNETPNSNFRSVPNLLLFPLSLTVSIIPFTFSLFLFP